MRPATPRSALSERQSYNVRLARYCEIDMTQKVLSQVDKDGNATVASEPAGGAQRVRPGNGRRSSIATLKKLEANPKVRAVVLMGQGKNFLRRRRHRAHEERAPNSRASRTCKAALASAQILHTLYTLKKPTIARVHGAVRGGGVGLVAAATSRSASRDATFRLSEVRLGIVPAMISPFVVAAIGERYARRYLLSGEEFDVRRGVPHRAPARPLSS